MTGFKTLLSGSFIPEKTRPLGADNKIVFSGMKLGAVETAPRNFIPEKIGFLEATNGYFFGIQFKTSEYRPAKRSVRS